MEEKARCPKGHEMERREGMFYWRGDSRPGWVCPTCNSLWPIKGEEIDPLRPALTSHTDTPKET